MSDKGVLLADEGGRVEKSSPSGGERHTLSWSGAGLFAALSAGGAWLDGHIAEVNALNVFPVPDGDTGTNMSMTMRAALEEVGERREIGVGELAHLVAHGALMGARGNSGVIFSQILRGLAREIDEAEELDAPGMAAALNEATATAYKGVMRPVEGTILTVIRESAEAATLAVYEKMSLEELMQVVLTRARDALARTPSMLPVLAEAGVVDAGGQGLVYVFEGMLRQLQGEAVDVVQPGTSVERHVHAPKDEQYNYDAQFIIQGEQLDLPMIRSRIAEMGDSTLVVGDEKAIKVHVHCDHPGEVLEFGITQGHVTAVIIENMQLQYEEFQAKAAAPVYVGVPFVAKAPATDTFVVAVASGEGLVKVFESLGVQAIVPGGQTMNPSTQDILMAIDSVPGEKAVILPNNKNIILAATQAQALAQKQVVVVPTKTIPQGIAALLAFNYQAELDENLELMSEACQQVETIEVTRAVRDAQINGLAVAEGQIIGLLNGNLVTGGDDAASVILSILERLGVEDYEIVTLYYGDEIDEDAAQQVGEAISQVYEDLEVDVLSGGQAHYHYIISVE